MLRIPLKRDLNDDGIVTDEESAIADKLSRIVRRRIIIGTAIFAIPCLVLTASSIGSAESGITDAYGVAETTRELAAVVPGFEDYTVGVETSLCKGLRAGKRQARGCRARHHQDKARQSRPRDGKEAHLPQRPRTRPGGIHYRVKLLRGDRTLSGWSQDLFFTRSSPARRESVTGAFYTCEFYKKRAMLQDATHLRPRPARKPLDKRRMPLCKHDQIIAMDGGLSRQLRQETVGLEYPLPGAPRASSSVSESASAMPRATTMPLASLTSKMSPAANGPWTPRMPTASKEEPLSVRACAAPAVVHRHGAVSLVAQSDPQAFAGRYRGA